MNIDLFRRVLEHYEGPNLPEMQYLGNTLTREFGVSEELHEEFASVFRDNCAYAQISSPADAVSKIRPLAGRTGRTTNAGLPVDQNVAILAEPATDTGLKCFVVMPFGEREPQHSPGFFTEVLKHLITPAGRDAGFAVATAKRDGSDVIQATIVNQLLDADLVVADLTENNPNVLFELGLRIAVDRPVALIRAKGTRAIFDVDNMLRVLEYDPNLWPSTVEFDKPRVRDHIKSTWDDRENGATYMKILRGRNSG